VIAQPDWNIRPLRELMRHIVRCHHGYLRNALPQLNHNIQRVLSKYGDNGPDPALARVFSNMWDELDLHVDKEETILFPYLDRLETAVSQALPPPHPGWVADNPLELMEDEHESAHEALRRMCELTGHYSIPDFACPTYRALMTGLQDLETDLAVHIHLENDILFPRARLLM